MIPRLILVLAFISCAFAIPYAVTVNDSIHSWGGNGFGLIGAGFVDTSLSYYPRRVPFPLQVSKICSARDVNAPRALVTTSGDLYAYE